MTAEKAHASSFRDLVITLASALVLVLLANAAADWVLDQHTPNLGYRLIRAKWKRLRELERPVDVVVLGDSSGAQAVDPRLLGAALAASAVNLCTIGDLGVVNDAWMLDEYVARFGPPRAAVVVHAYDVWARAPEAEVVAKLPLDFGAWSRLDPPIHFGLRQNVHAALSRYFPLYADRKSLAMLIRPGVVVALPPVEDGFLARERANPEQVRRDEKEHLAALRAGGAPLASENARALERIGVLASARGFNVFVAGGPVSDGLARSPEFRERLGALGLALERAAGRGRVRFILRDPVTFPAECLENVDHVTVDGARAYTERLAAAITQVAGQR